MTTATLTLSDAISELEPFLSEDFIRTWRRLGHALGYRVIGRALAGLNLQAQRRQEEDDESYCRRQQELDQMEQWLRENPVLTFQRLRQVSRIRKGAYGHDAGKPKPYLIEQVTVPPRLAEQLRERGIMVEYNKRTSEWWADAEDEAWGSDDWISECYGGREVSWDVAINLLRQANLYTQTLKENGR